MNPEAGPGNPLSHTSSYEGRRSHLRISRRVQGERVRVLSCSLHKREYRAVNTEKLKFHLIVFQGVREL